MFFLAAVSVNDRLNVLVCMGLMLYLQTVKAFTTKIRAFLSFYLKPRVNHLFREKEKKLDSTSTDSWV